MKPLIVCVDDNEALLAAIARSLRRDPNLEVRTTTDPDEVLHWIATEDVALLISDYEMPQMTGAQLAGKAKRTRAETVRILLTGMRSLDTAIDGINQGEIFRFIKKPFDEKILREAVRDAIVRHEELVALSGERSRRERREQLHVALEAEYPGISRVERVNDCVMVSADPWQDAIVMGLAGLDRKLEQP